MAKLLLLCSRKYIYIMVLQKKKKKTIIIISTISLRIVHQELKVKNAGLKRKKHNFFFAFSFVLCCRLFQAHLISEGKVRPPTIIILLIIIIQRGIRIKRRETKKKKVNTRICKNRYIHSRFKTL